MSGAPLLIIAAAALREQEEKREKERLEQLVKQTAQEKIAYLAGRAANWKTDEDVVAAFEDVLNGNCSFNSMQTGKIEEISIKNFFAFLTQFKEKKEIVRIIKEHKLFKRTLKNHPRQISSFIKATCCRNSIIGQGKDGYSVEQDFYQNRQQIFKNYCPEQRKPVCPNSAPLWQVILHFSFESFLESLQENVHPALKEALSKDVVVPATIMASGDKEIEKIYRKYLEKKELLYCVDKKMIAQTFLQARELSQTPEYQNLFVSPCPAVKTKWKYGIFPVRTIDTTQEYECPIIKNMLKKQNTR